MAAGSKQARRPGDGFKWGGNGRDRGTDRRSRRGAAVAAAGGGIEGNGNRCKHCFVGYRGSSLVEIRLLLGRSVGRSRSTDGEDENAMMP